MASKLVLGTVELGMRYGLNNTTGQPNREEAFTILDKAFAGGIDTLDTAWAYGTAEDVIGEWLTARGVAGSVNIISKLKPHSLDDYPGASAQEAVISEVKKSLARLKVKKLDGYLLHTSQYIYNDRVIEALREIKSAGLVSHIGVSTYDEPEALHAIALGLDYIQVP